MGALLEGRLVRRLYPSANEGIAREGEEWLSIHRYWFGYVCDGDRATVLSVLDATSDMPSRR